MPDLIGSVVSLTGYRDRDRVDCTVVAVVADWLQPLALSLYRCVGAAPEPGNPPWALLDVPVGRDGGAPLLSLLPVWVGSERFGLLNRKTFDDQFIKCLGEQAAGGAALWLGLIDIDHFKRVNDGFGHLIGDEVLLLVARPRRSVFRHGDRLYRFGGEEFVVLLRADAREHAELAFERFRAQMEAFRFPQVGPVTVGVGFTRLRPLDNASDAFERANQAVHHAKQHGRNQVRCHDALVETGEFREEGQTGEIELF